MTPLPNFTNPPPPPQQPPGGGLPRLGTGAGPSGGRVSISTPPTGQNSIPVPGGGSLPPGISDFLVQSGSFVGITDAGGGLDIAFRYAFPSGLNCFLAMPGDDTGSIGMIVCQPFVGASGLGAMHVLVLVRTGTAAAGLQCRINWLAIGW